MGEESSILICTRDVLHESPIRECERESYLFTQSTLTYLVWEDYEILLTGEAGSGVFTIRFCRILEPAPDQRRLSFFRRKVALPTLVCCFHLKNPTPCFAVLLCCFISEFTVRKQAESGVYTVALKGSILALPMIYSCAFTTTSFMRSAG